MFTDVVGYAARVQADEGSALHALEQHNRLLRPIFSRFAGRVVKTMGDAFLVEFESALDAVRCAIEVQRSLREVGSSVPEAERIRVRVGVHVGDVVQTRDDVLGDAVNIASRIQPLAEPGGICLSQQVVDQVQNKIPMPLARLPPVALKHIRIPVTIYRVVLPWSSVATVLPPSEPPGARQLAVLPLANISPDPGDGYFADGLTEELISVLSHVRGLSVIARTSVMPYKTAPKSVAEVGAELGVDTVLEGSVRKAGNRIRITLQLVDVPTQQHVWATSYNRELDDVFAVQSDIAERTADALRLELRPTDGTQPKRPPTTNLAAYDLYLRGLAMLRESLPNGLDRAVRCFERATRLDPEFAEAYAACANAYIAAGGDSISMRKVVPKARKLIARALEIDPESSSAHSALANLVFQSEHNWALAEAEFQKAIALNPSNVEAYRFYGLMTFALGRFDQAKELLRHGAQLDPRGHFQATLAWAEFESGNLAEGIRFAEAERDRHPKEVEYHVYVGMYYLGAGRRKDALREADTPLGDADDGARFDHALLNALLGRPAAAREMLGRIARGEAKTYTSPTDRAMMYAAMGEKAKALDLLEQDFREGDPTLWLWYRGVFFDSIRDEPRFVALLREYGLPTGTIPRLETRRRSSTGPTTRRARARSRAG